MSEIQKTAELLNRSHSLPLVSNLWSVFTDYVFWNMLMTCFVLTHAKCFTLGICICFVPLVSHKCVRTTDLGSGYFIHLGHLISLMAHL